MSSTDQRSPAKTMSFFYFIFLSKSLPQTKGLTNSVVVGAVFFERVPADICPPPIRDLLQRFF